MFGRSMAWTSIFSPANSSSFSAPRARESPRCSTSSAASTCRPAGTLTYRGWDLTVADEDALTHFRRDSVGFIFQFYNLIPSLTGRENVALITDIARDPMAPEEALALVDLSDRMDHFPSQMSGGQQQRVAIARAIAKRPKCFCATNPPARST
jgi:ABC-type lipoprotein export system ATPase subunit